MPRPPNPKSKFPQLIIKASNIEQEKKIRGAKEIVARNHLTMIDILEPFLKEHRWPPGNSQTLLETFGSKPTLICVYCGKGGFKTLRKVMTPGGEMSVCKSCYEDLKFRRLIKK